MIIMTILNIIIIFFIILIIIWPSSYSLASYSSSYASSYASYNIGVKPGDPAAYVLFAFALNCFRAQLIKHCKINIFGGDSPIIWIGPDPYQ